ncbi:Hypothetical protein ABZS17I87_00437 [Kosakonia cowanii]|nr:hypothetical protein [Kosakonia cowanii]
MKKTSCNQYTPEFRQQALDSRTASAWSTLPVNSPCTTLSSTLAQ